MKTEGMRGAGALAPLVILLACSGASIDGDPSSAADMSTARPGPHQVSIGKAGDGDGLIKDTAGLISCGAQCSAAVPDGGGLTLEALANGQSRFEGWSGACTGTGRCTITPHGAVQVTARFSRLFDPTWQIVFNDSRTQLKGIWASSPTDLYLIVDNLLRRFDGMSFTTIDSITDPDAQFGGGLWGRSAGQVWAVREQLKRFGLCESSGSGNSCMYEHELTRHSGAAKTSYGAVGGAWRLVGKPQPFTTALWGAAGAAAPYAVDCGLKRWTGSSFETVDSACLHDVWGTSESEIWVVGDGGQVRHTSDGRTWAVVNSGTNRSLYTVWGSDASHYWAAGQDGVVLAWDGSKWALQHTARASIRQLWGSGSRDVWAVGDAGLITHWDGERWQETRSGTTNDLRDIWGSDAVNVWVIGAQGIMLKLN